MQNYSDSRTVFIKNLLRYYLYKTHFYRSDGAENKVPDDVDKKSSILGDVEGEKNNGKRDKHKDDLKRKVIDELYDV